MERVLDPFHALDHDQRADFEKIFRLGILLGSSVRLDADAGEQFFFACQRRFDCGN
jgi:hypothetical protein